MDAQITNEKEYEEMMVVIETILNKATALGGFSKLSTEEIVKLNGLSRLSEIYEDQVLKLTPIVPKY